MGLYLGGTAIDSVRSLDDRVATVLALIPDGLTWVEWATSAPGQAFEFDNDAQFVRATLSGLHDTGLMSLRELGLSVSPLRLLELDQRELDILLEREEGEQGGGLADARAGRILHAHDLMVDQELIAVEDFMANLDLPAKDASPVAPPRYPFLLTMTLDARIALARELLDVTDPASTDRRTQRDAAEFAGEHAVTSAEFADYYGAYALMHERLDGTPRSEIRSAVRRARDELVRHLFPCLRCPVFSGPPTPERLHEELVRWTDSGSELGFRTIASGFRQVTANTEGTYADAAEAGAAVAAVVGAIHEAIRAREPYGLVIGQDGSTLTYTVGDGRRIVELTLGADGQLTVSRLEPPGRARGVSARPNHRTPDEQETT